MKSFIIFEKLISGEITQNEIIDNIFLIKGKCGRHNMMANLMEHLYEYTRLIILQGKNKVTEKMNLNELKAKYIGYILTILVLKYYSRLLNSLSELYNEESIHITTSKKNITHKINLNIINKFIENFPVFKEFMEISINTLIGEKVLD